MKKLFLFALVFSIVFLMVSVNALTFETNKYAFSKGEIITIKGEAVRDVTVSMIASNGLKKVFQEVAKLDVETQSFKMYSEIECTDPSGEWQIVVDDRENTLVKKILVNNSNDCAFLTATFFSPSISTYSRTQEIDITVKLSDAGSPVNNGRVFFWDLQGIKRTLAFQGEGIYSFEKYEIPFNAPIADWDLMVVSSTRKATGIIGGESTIKIRVEQAPILIEVLEPKAKEFNVGQPLNFKIKTTYNGGKPIDNPKLRALINNQSIEFKKEGEFFVASIPTADVNNVVLTVELIAEDSVGNTGTQKLSLEPVGFLLWVLQKNFIYYIFPLLFVIYVLFLSSKELKIFLRKAAFDRKKKKILILQKKLQEDYFNKQLINRKMFENQSDYYDSELDKIEEQLKNLRKKREL